MHEWRLPARTPSPVVMPLTMTGAARSAVPPLPSWPCELSPQQRAVPLLSTAHVWNDPAPMDTALEIPLTRVGERRPWNEPWPSCPCVPEPQQRIVPPEMRAQVWYLPAVMPTADVIPDTVTGVPLVRPSTRCRAGPTRRCPST